MSATSPRILVLIENISYREDTRVRRIARSLHHAGYGVSVVCPRGRHDPPKAVLDGVTVRFFPYRDLARLGVLGHLVEYLYCGLQLAAVTIWRAARRQVDVVHLCVPPHVLFPIGLGAHLFRVKLVVDQHDLMPELYELRYGSGHRMMRWLLERAERAALRIPDHVLVTNGSGARVAVERAGVPAHRVSVVLTCPDVPSPPDDGRLPSRPFTVAYVGNIDRQDGVEMVVETARAVHLDHGHREIRFLCIGDGPELDRVERLAAQLGIDGVVEFTGRLPHDEVMRRLASCDVCIQPDPPNVFNDTCTMLKTLEYLALDKPVVAFALRETLAACEDAALYAMGNEASELASLVVQLASDAGLRARLSAAARRRIDEHLGWRHFEPVLLDVYEALAPLPRPSGLGEIESAPVNIGGYR